MSKPGSTSPRRARRQGKLQLWCWTLCGEDNRKMAVNVEKYYNKADCLAAIEKVRQSSEAPVRER
ncbi:YegP family protein [Variovorax sp. LjRoot175]|uniref:DUF1508 domain-containing protein n=1 Tax=Variovorax sp. LjRoot175 TaxID=3342276 RepID=UPI003ECE7A91